MQVQNALERIDVLNRDSQYGLEMAMQNMGNAIAQFSVPTFGDTDALRDLNAVDGSTIRTMLLVTVAEEYQTYITSSMPLARGMSAADRENYLGDMRWRIEAMRQNAALLRTRLEAIMDEADLG